MNEIDSTLLERQTFPCCTWLLFSSFAHAVHLAFWEQERKLVPTRKIHLSLPQYQREDYVLDVAFIEDATIRMKHLLSLNEKKEDKSLNDKSIIQYRETWIQNPCTSQLPCKLVGSVSKTKREHLSMDVVIAPEEDSISCALSLQKDSSLCHLSLDAIYFHFTQTLNSQIQPIPQDTESSS